MSDQEYIKKLEKSAADYVALTQPELEKLAEYRKADAAFVKLASHAVQVLAENGVIDRSDVSAVVDKIAADHSTVFTIMENMAPHVRVPGMGSETEVRETETAKDPWLEAFS